jgi:hypothetical protein
MKKTDLAYMAGLFDGEGYAGIKKKNDHRTNVVRYMPRAMIGLTNEYLPQLLKFQFGGSLYHRHSQGNRKDLWMWEVSGSDAIAFLKVILPYLILKKPQAEILLKFNMIKGERNTYTPLDRILGETQSLKIKELNQRGIKN